MHAISHTDMAGSNVMVMFKDSTITSNIRIIDFGPLSKTVKTMVAHSQRDSCPSAIALHAMSVTLLVVTEKTWNGMSGSKVMSDIDMYRMLEMVVMAYALSAYENRYQSRSWYIQLSGRAVNRN